jgi:OOP family OmpA-OmpF porin
MVKKFTIVLCAIALSACAGMELDKAKRVFPQGAPYERLQFKELVDRAADEYGEGDYVNSDFFAIRAQRVSAREQVLPTMVSDRQIPAGAVDALNNARSRFMIAMQSDAASKAPKAFAKAYIAYECWLEEQEENRQPDDIAECRKAFDEAMAAVDKALAPKPMAAAPAPAPAPAAAPAPARYTVYFGFDSSQVVAGSIDVVRAGARGPTPGGAHVRVTLVGHADRSGNADYNVRLSKSRTEAVRAGLVAEGVAASRIETDFRGETEPAKKTEDGMKEGLNRRVMITIE